MHRTRKGCALIFTSPSSPTSNVRLLMIAVRRFLVTEKPFNERELAGPGPSTALACWNLPVLGKKGSLPKPGPGTATKVDFTNLNSGGIFGATGGRWAGLLGGAPARPP